MTRQFRTLSLPLAGWLCSSKKLAFEGVEQEGRRTVFIFSDPEAIGETLEIEYESGPFSAFYHQVKILRKIMDAPANRERRTYEHCSRS